jgi:hypothetical protein
MANTDTQLQIIRQSSLKAAVEFFQGKDYSLQDVMRITMAFEQYCFDGNLDIVTQLKSKY